MGSGQNSPLFARLVFEKWEETFDNLFLTLTMPFLSVNVYFISLVVDGEICFSGFSHFLADKADQSVDFCEVIQWFSV